MLNFIVGVKISPKRRGSSGLKNLTRSQPDELRDDDSGKMNTRKQFR
jgi:hypothetical protein